MTRRTVLIYRGKSEKHAECRSVLRAKPWKEVTYDNRNFLQFLNDFVGWSESYFVYPKGKTQADEDWINRNMGKIGFKFFNRDDLTF